MPVNQKTMGTSTFDVCVKKISTGEPAAIAAARSAAPRSPCTASASRRVRSTMPTPIATESAREIVMNTVMSRHGCSKQLMRMRGKQPRSSSPRSATTESHGM